MSARRAGGAVVEIAADPEDLARQAAEEVVAGLARALEQRGRASWVLAGGSTPRRLYELLAERPRALDWRRVELYWGDERCVGPESPASNFALARDTLLADLPLAPERVHRIRGELPPEEAARRYSRRVAAALARGPFDLVLLGLGADGHVASLFPGAELPSGPLAAAIEAPNEAPIEAAAGAATGPRWRVSLTPEALASTRRLLFLVRGRAKAPALARALDPRHRAVLVSDRVQPHRGETLWLVDREAAAGLAP